MQGDEAIADGKWTPRGAIPQHLRTFGKFPKTDSWWPGDLILTRETTPDRVSVAITTAQKKGGYAPLDARWTHAAVYLGDGQNICEATFSSFFSGSVVFNPLWNYCGSHALRIRRSSLVTDKEKGWRLAIYALTHMGKKYDFRNALHIGRQAYKGRGFWQNDLKVKINRQALICSTLYSDSHAMATERPLGEANGLCVPAFLSQCAVFTEVESAWLSIG
jgi:hypothetical protein